MKKKKVLLTTIGTLGDLNPLIALAKVLEKQDFVVHIAACEDYRPNFEAEGLTYKSVAPHYNPNSKELCEAILHPLKTLPFFYRRILNGENLRRSVEDFDQLVKDYDLICGNVFSYAAKISCLKNHKKWASINLSPTCFFSIYDPPSLYPINFLNHMKWGRELLFKIIYKTIFKLVDLWGRDVHQMYRDLKLASAGNLLRQAPFSQDLNLAIYSKTLGGSQRDWPEHTVQSGFLFYSAPSSRDLTKLNRFLDQNQKKPILFTFGSTALISFEQHYEMILNVSKELVEKFDLPVVITMNSQMQKKYSEGLDERIFLCDYLPYTEYMERMRLIVHQGGIGTVSPCLRSGTPQLILPGCTDQFDNAYRIERLGIGLGLPLKRLNQKSLQSYLETILEDTEYENRARRIQKTVIAEDSESIIIQEIQKLF